MEPFQVLAFDPGGATGWAHIVHWSPDEFQTLSGTIWEEEHHGKIRDDIELFYGTDVPLTVVTESFEFRQNPDSAMKRRGLELVSREYIGVMKLVCKDLGILPLMQQMPAHALSFMTDTKLEKMGHLRTPLHPCRHENDALRHLFFYLISTLKIKEWRDKLKT